MVDPSAMRHPVLPLSCLELRECLIRILAAAGMGDVFDSVSPVELRITSDREIARLHRRHLGGMGPTNVLSFPTTSESSPEALQGSIIISADAVIREASLYGQDPRDHFIRLLTHAVLHLAGFSHGASMDAITDQVVEYLHENAPTPSPAPVSVH